MEMRRFLSVGLGVLALAACATQSAASEDAALTKYAAAYGYQRSERDGKPVYCRVVVPTGSGVPRTDCVSAQEMADREYNSNHRIGSPLWAPPSTTGAPPTAVR